MSFRKLFNDLAKQARIPYATSNFSMTATHLHKRDTLMVNPLDWNLVVKEAENVVGYPTSFMNLRWLLSDELANVASHLQKLVGSGHPLLNTTRDIFLQNDLPSWGLIVLLMSKAVGFRSDFLEPHDIFAGVLHSQRALAEITEMIRKSILIHKGLLNFAATETNADTLNFGNKMALLCGDYLLCKSYHELAELRNQHVNELISSALRDLVDCEFVGPRDKQNKPFPAEPDKQPAKTVDKNNNESILLTPVNVKNALGNAEAEWTVRNILGGASLLGRSCQCTINLAGHADDLQQMGYRFGKHLALAWQAWIDKNSITKWRSGCFSLVSAPVLFHIQHEPEVYDEIRGRDDVNEVDYDKLHKIVSSGPGLQKTCELQWEHSKIALDVLEVLPAGDARDALLNIINVFKQP